MAVATKHVKNGAFNGGLLHALKVNLYSYIRKNDMKTRNHACHTTSVTYSDEYLRTRFAGKVAICTASTAGIGYSAAERIAREGAKVVICSRRQENVDDAVKKLRNQNLEASGIVCHQAKKEDRQRLVDYTINTYGGIDLLFTSAGVNTHKGHMFSVTEEQWDKMFDVNLKSTFLMIRECVPYMMQRGGGAIVTNSTIGAVYPHKTADAFGPYSISKMCIISLTDLLAEPLGNHNIRINTVAPGPIKTRFFHGFYDNVPAGAEDAVGKMMITLLNRHGHPDECGAAVAFLLSDDASFITGETLVVSGGVFRKTT